LVALKTYRDWGLATKGIKDPEAILPSTAHPAFNKACAYFKIKAVIVDVEVESQKVDPKKVESLINENTVCIVGSAPNYPGNFILLTN
jgi:sphinganine-1-phosphate aldolase